MLRLVWYIGIALAMLSTSTFAQTSMCLNDGTSHDALRCEEVKLNEAERNLNSAYTHLLAELKGSKARDGLVHAQREWIKFRDLDCDAKFELRPDADLRSWYPMACRREHAKQRTAQLSKWTSD